MPNTLTPEDLEYHDETILFRDCVHPDLADYDRIAKSAVLASFRKIAAEDKKDFFEKLPGTAVTPIGITALSGDLPVEVCNAAKDFVNQLDFPGLPSHRLQLKVDVIIFFMCIISLKDQIANGT